MSDITKLAQEARRLIFTSGLKLLYIQTRCEDGMDTNSEESHKQARELNTIVGLHDGFFHAVKLMLSAAEWQQFTRELFVICPNIHEETIEAGLERARELIVDIPERSDETSFSA